MTLIYESNTSKVYRDYIQGKSFIIKALKDYPTAIGRYHYQQEYDLVKKLDSQYIIKIFDLNRQGNNLRLLVEDFGGESLASLYQKKITFSLEQLLSIFIRMVKAIDVVHKANIIHKDINPSNIIYNKETDTVKLIDFGISTYLSHENKSAQNPNKIEGTIAYISPEQTGRINKTLDYRADFYSLGVSFYELLTTRLPFEKQDTIEMMHCHLAETPEPISHFKPDIPPVLSDIVMKLMQKEPEKRYQSAQGLLADLITCYDMLKNTQTINSFSLASQDYSDKFYLPQKIYGREQVLEKLKQHFTYTYHGHTKCCFIKGDAGIGKSALINELYKTTAIKKSYFIKGKFENTQNSKPYSGIIYSFQELIAIISSEHVDKLAQWKQKIIQKVGVNAQILIQLLPELKTLLGEQPPVPILNNEQAKNRFRMVFQDFLQVFCQAEHPLVIFLDNLQWIDNNSLDLLEAMLEQEQSLFILGAYRDNEASESLNTFIENTPKIELLTLENLTHNAVSQWIEETFFRQDKRFIKVLMQKTKGNPFFIKEFLKSLYNNKLITFNKQEKAWICDIKSIIYEKVTDNVVNVLIKKIKKLPLNTQNFLELAACSCIGNTFNIKTLIKVSNKKIQDILPEIITSIEEEFIIPLQEGYQYIEEHNIDSFNFEFVHDRVRQAADSLIASNAQRSTLHLQIAQYLESNAEDIFSIIHHYSQATDIIEKEEYINVANCYLEAAQKSKLESYAFKDAFHYIKQAFALVKIENWQIDYDFMLSLYIEACELAYLNADKPYLEQISQIALQHIKTEEEKAVIYNILIHAYNGNMELDKSIEIGLNYLKKLDLEISINVTKQDILQRMDYIDNFLKNKKIASLANTKLTHNIKQIEILKVLEPIQNASYYINPNLFLIIVLERIKILLEYGNLFNNATAYASYAVVLLQKDLKKANEFANLALQMTENNNQKSQAILVYFVVYGIVKPWKYAYKEVLEDLKQAYDIGLQLGNFDFAAKCMHLQTSYSYFAGLALGEIIPKMAETEIAFKRFHQEITYYMSSIYHQALLNLSQPNKTPWLFQGPVYTEENEEINLEKTSNFTGLFNLYFNKLILYYLFEKYHEAGLYAEKVNKTLQGIVGFATLGIVNFYQALVKLALSSRKEEKSSLKEQTLKPLLQFARKNPKTFSQKYYLVKAVYCSIIRKHWLAREYFDRAIYFAQKNEYTNDEALSYELAGKFYHDYKNNHELAQYYFSQAFNTYKAWGAKAKAAHLEENYAHFLKNTTVETNNINKTSGSTEISATVIDSETLFKNYEAITKERELRPLLSKLLSIVIENAGAERGVLILKDENNESILKIQGIKYINQPAEVLQNSLLDQNLLPVNIIYYVYNRKEEVVLDNAAKEDKFIHDPYIHQHQIASVFCLPLFYQNEKIGVLYLENSLNEGVFSQRRKKMMTLLSSNIAIFIQNAILYSKVQDNERNLQQFFQSIPMGVMVIDATGKIYFSNDKAKKLLNHNLEENNEENNIDIYNIFKQYQFYLKDSNIIYPREELPIIQALQGQAHTITNLEINISGKKIPIESTGMPILDKNKKVIYSMCVFQDISDRLATEKVLQQEKETRAVLKAKSDFLAKLSHEIRTPMTAILGAIYAGQQSYSITEKDNNLQRIKTASDGLLKLINNILNLSKIEAGKFSLKNDIFDLQESLEKIANIYNGLVHEKTLELFIKIDKKVPYTLIGDALCLEQILINLMSNAIKFTERGKIIIKITAENKTNKMVDLVFSVIDTGIGIAKQQKEKLFQPFEQIDGSITRKYGGSGLGLSLVKEFVLMMKGDIQVESIEGQGSTFSVTLPFAYLAPYKTKIMIGSGKKVAIVTKSQETREILHNILSSSGFEITDMEKENDIVILDFSLPNIKLLIDTLYKKQANTCIIIMVSALDCEIARRTLGVNFILEKPILENNVLKVLEMVNQENQEQTKELRYPYFKDTHVLVADDNSVNRDIIQQILETINISATLVENGRQAIQALKEKEYNLLLLDIEMPEMDGYETAKKIRKFNPTIPIIAITAHVTQEYLNKVKPSGMNSYIAKPFEINKLHQKIQDFLPKKYTMKTFQKPNINYKEINGINVPIVLERLHYNEVFLYKSLIKFKNNYSTFTQHIKNALEQKNFNSAKLKAHSLKNVATNLAADTVYQYAKKLEENIIYQRNNEIPNNLIRLEEALHTIFDQSVIFEAHLKKIDKSKERKIYHMLCELKNLLKENNLAANHIIETLNSLLPNHYNDEKIKLNQYIKTLEYEKAISIVDQLIEQFPI